LAASMTKMTAPMSPGWYDDPTSRHDFRYWDGTEWTDSVADHGITAHDAATFSPPAPVSQPTRAPAAAPARATPPPSPSTTVASAAPATAEPLRTCVPGGPRAVWGTWVASLAGSLLIALGTVQVVLAFGTSSTSANLPADGEIFWATRGTPGVLVQISTMGPLFLALLVTRAIVARTNRVKPPRAKRTRGLALWRPEPGIPRKTYLFKVKGLTAKLVITTILSIAMVAAYVGLTVSLSNDGYDIRTFGWVALVLMVVMVLGDGLTLSSPRRERVRIDRSKNVYAQADAVSGLD
jgi:Protein of unknown function (DUF2510)